MTFGAGGKRKLQRYILFRHWRKRQAMCCHRLIIYLSQNRLLHSFSKIRDSLFVIHIPRANYPCAAVCMSIRLIKLESFKKGCVVGNPN